MRDTIVVGAGLAGLSAAWRLRKRDVLVLESGTRVGGRLRSERRGEHVLNWGGHMFAGAGSRTDELLHSSGTAALDIPGTLSGLSMNGRLLLRGPALSYPLRAPMPLRARAALLTTGARVSLDVLRYAARVRSRPGESAEARQQRILDFENRRSFADYLGELPEDAEALFRPTVTRSSAEPEQLSAGAGIGYFSLVWNLGQGLGRAVEGGAQTLPENLAAGLPGRIRLGAEVHEVLQRGDHVVVRYREDGQDHEVTARTAVLATPAPITRRLGVDLPADLREALGRIVYGSYVSAALLTGEEGPRRWDRAYAIAAPKRSFAVVLNTGNLVHGRRTERRPGGSLMVFSPASLADALLAQDDETILTTYLQDLEQVLPGSSALVQEARIQRWALGAPYSFPGRAALQPVLTRPAGRVLLAGDYLGTLYTETAVSSGLTAAERAETLLLGTGRNGPAEVRSPSTRGRNADDTE